MNIRLSVRFSVCLLPVLLGCATSIAGDGGAQGSHDVRISVQDVQFQVFFEDPTLTVDKRAAIVADYQFILDQLAPQGRRRLEPRMIQQGRSSVWTTGVLLYSETQYKRPRATRNQLGIIGRLENGQECIVIEQRLSDEYKNALALEAAHEEACRSLPDFVSLLNNLTETKMPPVKDFLYLYGELMENSDESAIAPKQKVIEAYGGFRYTGTSILELRMFEGRLATTVHAVRTDDDYVYERPVIYDDDRWKLIVARPGT